MDPGYPSLYPLPVGLTSWKVSVGAKDGEYFSLNTQTSKKKKREGGGDNDGAGVRRR